ncbi:hypothetical protein PPL_08017 [Heterostelium album PN500]|uniref:Uncharacterized protein n=1 Tax=Heterostelium pallidum (strain ATCC 26659 / Pp 5 / PN500) TaxID=670386 RepID=D3BHL4_HETP5|nr:hypothetical protein PPL_08017 [Heterostelium album PN500]EFA79191.1 hypothetical protein PPL_08017 [Heterostelium album PN500]|eukprot:XP_020431312.1 hypothetical protein PPL_08017 [Heterostelium album PN500]
MPKWFITNEKEFERLEQRSYKVYKRPIVLIFWTNDSDYEGDEKEYIIKKICTNPKYDFLFAFIRKEDVRRVDKEHILSNDHTHMEWGISFASFRNGREVGFWDEYDDGMQKTRAFFQKMLKKKASQYIDSDDSDVSDDDQKEEDFNPPKDK